MDHNFKRDFDVSSDIEQLLVDELTKSINK